MGRPSREETKRKNRKERIPLGVTKLKLSYENQDPGYSYRVIHDKPHDPGRIQRALEGSWEFVDKKTDNEHLGDPDVSNEDAGLDTRITHVVGTDAAGQPMVGYLMRIPKDLYKEDQQAKMDEIDKVEESLYQGVDNYGQPGNAGRYIPGNPADQNRQALKIKRE